MFTRQRTMLLSSDRFFSSPQRLLRLQLPEQTVLMPAVKIQQGLWNDLLSIAEKQRRRPETLANEALRDFLQRTADVELLSRSAAAARRSPLPIAETEKAIRRHRRKR